MAIGLVEHMGDIVAAEPILRQLRHDHPNACIAWCVREPFRELLESNPLLDETLVVSCLTEWIFLRRSGVFDKILDLHIQGRECPICFVPLRRPEGNQDIVIENYLDFGDLLEVMVQYTDLVVHDRQPRLEIPPEVRAKVDRFALPANYAVFHCASNELVRNWPIDKWRQLAAELVRSDSVAVVEVGLQAVIASEPGSPCRNMCGNVGLLEMAEVIRRASLFVGVDSGPAHIANAVQTYGVVLMGPYRRFERHVPFSGDYKSGANATILYEPTGLANLSTERVLSEIDRVLARRRDALGGSDEAEAGEARIPVRDNDQEARDGQAAD